MPHKDHDKYLENKRAWNDANREKVRDYYWRNREKCSVKGAAWRAANREAKKRMDAAWHKAHPEAKRKTQRKYNLKKYYGLTLEAYDALREQQANCCAICGQEKPLVVDHCHKTTVVRGLLCQPCNRGLGQFGDDPARLESATAYLKKAAYGE